MKQRIIISDCDGVLTDGKFTYTSNGKFTKEYGAHDNDGIKLLKKNGYEVIFISADERGFDITSKRIKDMNCEIHLVKEEDRYKWIKDNYGFENIIYIGDGLSDAPILNETLSIAPANAIDEAKNSATYVTKNPGGNGAFYEAAKFILGEDTKSVNDFYELKVNVLNEINKTLNHIDLDDLDSFITGLFNHKKIICVGAGRMGYSIRAFAMRLMHLGFNNVSFIGDTNVPYADSDTLVIFNTSSGNTPTNVLYAKQAYDNGSTIFVITEKKDSNIIKYANLSIILNEIESKQPMKTRSEQSSYIFFDILVMLIMQRANLKNDSLVKNHSILE